MKNVGKLDRIIRVVLGFAFLYVGGAMFAGVVSWLFYILALIMWYTAWTQTCPLYPMIGMKGSAAGESKPAHKHKKR